MPRVLLFPLHFTHCFPFVTDLPLFLPMPMLISCSIPTELKKMTQTVPNLKITSDKSNRGPVKARHVRVALSIR